MSFIFPNICFACEARVPPPNSLLCEQCAAALPVLPTPRCPGCGGVLDGVTALCAECLTREESRPWDLAIAALPYRGTVRDIVRDFKYHGKTHLVRLLADRMLDAWHQHGNTPIDAFVPVPLHWSKKLTRGYNQAALLADLLGKALDVPVVHALTRGRRTRQQARLKFQERTRNMHGSFRLRQQAKLSGARIVLIDDVFTTGATLSAAAQALDTARVKSLSVLCAARG